MDDITVYECKDGRTRAYIKDTKSVISYPRYLLEKKLGRKLLENEQVHHKDGNPRKNELDNLEIKLLGEHQREHNPAKYHDKTMICPWCQREFLWTAKQQSTFNRNRKRKDRVSRNTTEPFCSKKCAFDYGRSIQQYKKQI